MMDRQMNRPRIGVCVFRAGDYWSLPRRYIMGREFQAQLSALGKQVRTAAISGGWEPTSDSCFGQLPELYEKFCQTNESRFGEEISRRLSVVLNELASDKRDCPKARK